MKHYLVLLSLISQALALATHDSMKYSTAIQRRAVSPKKSSSSSSSSPRAPAGLAGSSLKRNPKPGGLSSGNAGKQLTRANSAPAGLSESSLQRMANADKADQATKTARQDRKAAEARTYRHKDVGKHLADMAIATPEGARNVEAWAYKNKSLASDVAKAKEGQLNAYKQAATASQIAGRLDRQDRNQRKAQYMQQAIQTDRLRQDFDKNTNRLLLKGLPLPMPRTPSIRSPEQAAAYATHGSEIAAHFRQSQNLMAASMQTGRLRYHEEGMDSD